MRNNIKINDPVRTNPILADLTIGELFAYPNAISTGNVYIRTAEGCVFLNTGGVFFDKNMNTSAEVIRVNSVTITRP